MNGLSTGRVGTGMYEFDRVHELEHAVDGVLVAFERLESGDAHDGDVVAGEVVLAEQLADLELDELEQLLVVDRIALVQRDDDVRHTDLTRQHDVLAGLGHGAVGRRDHEDRAVHLGCAGDHVLDVVRVSGAVDVRVVARLRLVLDVRGRDRDTARLLFRRVVDLVERHEGVVATDALLESLGDGSSQRGLAMVDVTDGSDIHVRLGALVFLLAHFVPLLNSCSLRCLS